jgi:FtsH-binding integral membrane protein
MKNLGKNDSFQNFIKAHPLLFIFIVLAPILLIIALALLPLPMYIKLVILTLFSICFGILLSVTSRYITTDLLNIVFIITMGIFVIMFIIGLLLAGFGYDLFWLGAILFFTLLVLLIVGIVMLFTHPDNKALRIRAILVVILFSVYIIYDTNQIIMRDYFGDYVTAGIDYYLDFLNVFVNLMELFSNSN